jgi:hypothetical protein
MRTPDLTLAIAAALALAGCSKEPDPKPATPGSGVTPPAAGDHSHVAPHGGEVLDLGDHEYHLELIHDHTGGRVTVYVLEADLKTPIAVAAPTIVIATKEGPKEFTLTAVNPAADGTADTWKGSHPGLIADPWDGRIRLTIRGKAFQSPLEGAPHGH